MIPSLVEFELRRALASTFSPLALLALTVSGALMAALVMGGRSARAGHVL